MQFWPFPDNSLTLGNLHHQTSGLSISKKSGRTTLLHQDKDNIKALQR